MKKKHVIFLLLFLGFALFTRCTKSKTLPTGTVMTIHKSAMPYYTIMDRNSIDSIMSTRVGNNYTEIVYFKDGKIESFYNFLNIKNIHLREKYNDYYSFYENAIRNLSFHYPTDEINFILFNGYLYSQHLPTLNRLDYLREINNKGPTPILESSINNTTLTIFGISSTLILLVLGNLIYINIYKPHFKNTT